MGLEAISASSLPLLLLLLLLYPLVCMNTRKLPCVGNARDGAPAVLVVPSAEWLMLQVEAAKLLLASCLPAYASFILQWTIKPINYCV